MQKVLIIGASGFLGTALRRVLRNWYEVVGTYNGRMSPNLRALDITNKGSVAQCFDAVRPDVAICTAGVADVEICERNPGLAAAINYEGVENIVEVCMRDGVKLVYMSTDFVFDGLFGGYTEIMSCEPVNVYGRTKLQGEREVQRLPNGLILRFGLLYGFNGRHEQNGFFGKLMNGGALQLNDVEPRQPLFVDDVGFAIHKLLVLNHAGIVHIAGPVVTTKYKLGLALETIVRPQSLLIAARSDNSAVPRPQNATLNAVHARKMGISPRSIEAGLEDMRRRYDN